MRTISKYRAGLSFVGGTVVGVVISLAVLHSSGFAVISQQVLDDQLQLIAGLQE